MVSLVDELRVRPWTRQDLSAIDAIEQAGFEEPWPVFLFDQEMSNDLARGIVVERDGLLGGDAIVGFALWWVVTTEIHLLVLAVRSDMQRRGVARLLMAELEQRALAEGAHEILLEVRPSNWAARALYDALGFEEVGRRPRYYRNQEDALILRRLVVPETKDQELEKARDGVD